MAIWYVNVLNWAWLHVKKQNKNNKNLKICTRVTLTCYAELLKLMVNLFIYFFKIPAIWDVYIGYNGNANEHTSTCWPFHYLMFDKPKNEPVFECMGILKPYGSQEEWLKWKWVASSSMIHFAPLESRAKSWGYKYAYANAVPITTLQSAQLIWIKSNPVKTHGHMLCTHAQVYVAEQPPYYLKVEEKAKELPL